MEISQLRYFVEICNCGSMVAAAEKMCITQQGISIAIRRLEKELDQDLFYQKNRRLYLTKYGTQFKVYAEAVVLQMDKLLHFVAGNSPDEKPRITVAVAKTSLTKLPAAAQQLLFNSTEDYSVDIIEAYSSECAEMVTNGLVDLALVYGYYSEVDYNVVLLEQIRQAIIVNRNSPFAAQEDISIRDLDNVPLLTSDPETWPTRDLTRMFREANVRLNTPYACNWPHQSVDMVANNPGLVARIQTSYLSAADLEKVKPLPLREHSFIMPFTMLTQKGRRFSASEQKLTRGIIDSFQHQDLQER